MAYIEPIDTIEEFPLDEIIIDAGTQARLVIDDDVVQDYAEAYERGEELPPVQVWSSTIEEGVCWLSDGFHRIEAKRRIGHVTINAVVKQGTLDSARWDSVSANKTHGLRRTNADKAIAVKMALQHPDGAELSDSQIAKHVGVSVNTVAKYREELESTMQIAKSTTRKGKDGRKINTAKIGKNAKQKAEPKAEPAPTPDVVDKPQHDPCPNCGCTERDEYGECPKCHDPCETVAPEPPAPVKPRGKGVELANEAINCLQNIPAKDALRKRGFQIVFDYCKAQLADLEADPSPPRSRVLWAGPRVNGSAELSSYFFTHET